MFSNKEYVCEVYKHRSFSKAAESLYISQPSLSLTIKKVEKRVGCPLFDRSSSPIRLTECGEEYIRCAQHILDIENGFKNYLGALQELATGGFTLGASNFFTSYILPPVLAHFKAQYPQVQVQLIEANTADLERQLFDGSLDLIIDNNEFDDTLYKKQFFYAEKIILALPGKFSTPALQPYALGITAISMGVHRLAETPAVPLALLAETPFLMLRRGNDTRQRADKIFESQGISPQVVLELDQLATAFHVAYRGLGATFASDTLAKEIDPAGTDMVYFKLEGPLASRANYFHYKHNKYLSRSMQAFLSAAAFYAENEAPAP